MPVPLGRSHAPRRAVVALVVALLGVSACGGTSAPAASSAGQATAQGPWTWTDDRGKNVSLPKRPEAEARFEAAGAALRKLAAERPDLSVMIVTGTPESLYVAYLPDHPDIAYWGELGLNIVSPERPTEREGGFWEVLSWENADRYQAGVILVDARSQSMKIEETAGKPTWAKLPAVRAGQLYPWHAAERYSYLGYAEVMEELVAELGRSRADVVKE